MSGIYVSLTDAEREALDVLSEIEAVGIRTLARRIIHDELVRRGVLVEVKEKAR